MEDSHPGENGIITRSILRVATICVISYAVAYRPALHELNISTSRAHSYVVVTVADDRPEHASALGTGSEGNAGKSRRFFAVGEGVDVYFDCLDDYIGERIPQGRVAHAHGSYRQAR